MKAPVTLSGCGSFVVSSASVLVPKSPAFHPSNPAKTETVSVPPLGGYGRLLLDTRELYIPVFEGAENSATSDRRYYATLLPWPLGVDAVPTSTCLVHLLVGALPTAG